MWHISRRRKTKVPGLHAKSLEHKEVACSQPDGLHFDHFAICALPDSNLPDILQEGERRKQYLALVRVQRKVADVGPSAGKRGGYNTENQRGIRLGMRCDDRLLVDVDINPCSVPPPRLNSSVISRSFIPRQFSPCTCASPACTCRSSLSASSRSKIVTGHGLRVCGLRNDARM